MLGFLDSTNKTIRIIGVLFGCFGRKIEGDSWFTWWFNHLPGPFISPKRTPMIRMRCISSVFQSWKPIPEAKGRIAPFSWNGEFRRIPCLLLCDFHIVASVSQLSTVRALDDLPSPFHRQFPA